MCHRRGEWSRTSSKASEPADEADDDAEWWGVRAKERLLAFVSAESETTDESPARPTVEADPAERGATDPAEDDPADTEEEREEDPIPADD